jgi:hypothetical protein
VTVPDVQVDVPAVEVPAIPDITITNQEPVAPAAVEPEPVAEPAASEPAD